MINVVRETRTMAEVNVILNLSKGGHELKVKLSWSDEF